ncbi:spore germination protein [Anoxybacteroides amylolyticum]|uniref:GerA spore germination family protein n=1 Tax=Anoxybacteroides amylolyticum TaxID=294699 RepID=A0A160F2W5_9BACL|nr:spore germination protein [Anoxybacillus amylolyticus]ANB60261.1 GerA spore germination family protein [Anoxybacillus amylolyticus]
MWFQWKKQLRKTTKRNEQSGQAKDGIDETVESELQRNIETVRNTTGNSVDVVIRRFLLGKEEGIPAALLFVSGIVDEEMIHQFLLESVVQLTIPPSYCREEALVYIEQKIAAAGKMKRIKRWSELFLALMSGEVILLIDGVPEALSVEAKGGEHRAIEEPATQLSIRGPREGFTESLATNVAMVRRRIQNPHLWLEAITIGEVTQTNVSIMYIKGIASDEIVEEVRRRLQRIRIDGILESGYIEQLIEDQTFTTFPTVYHTERPDSVAANLLEGRIAIFVEGTPFVLIAPTVFIQFFQAVEDYYARFDIATALRFLRVLVFFISLVAPSVYIAVTTFHQEMMPTQLVIAIAAQRESVPFPAFVEALMMEVTFEILREAGVRLPRAVGQAVSIVGALVIGQAAVEAGFVSSAMVIVVSITAIASFATPSFAIAISARLIRFLLMVLAALFGFYGILIGIVLMTLHLCSLRSFGVPYMSPLAPLILSNIRDTLVRFPMWALTERPRLINQTNMVRQGNDQRPKPPNQPEKEGDNH